ncbi:MAG: hypothetical protein CVV42_18060 [Candidatus Riflebacteria bacterium HGW-Riflebacteria-2]|jgi:hypothetical protein|nr:MAG: hypothetical protein CVV42_18060 [Candidatus Riflebacteria bacterium HGW-Riflebacteria-2]
MKYFSSGHRAVLTTVLLGALTSGLYGADGLILPMPGQKAMDKASATVNLVKEQPKPKKPDNSGAIIHLPKQIKPLPPTPKPETPVEPTPVQDRPLLPIATPPPPPDPVLMDDIPVPPDEVVISPNDSMNDLIPPVPPPEVPANNSSGDGTLPVFPKDTSSAIFMVMKSWQCESYDGNTLLTHAVEVYSKEADDTFKIEGLSATDEFLISVEEEDITLDELLDILAMKSGRDWGVDIPSKVIYFYPKGVRTDAYNVW